MNILITISFYFMGCALAYGRITASFYDMRITQEMGILRTIVVFCSWLGFIVGIGHYIINHERYFFKWNDW